MKHSTRTQSATSLPPAPQDEVDARKTKYAIMMSVRVVCFVLMAIVTPYGWYTWAFAIGAVVLPYLAVVVANVGSDTQETTAEAPQRALTESPAPATTPDSSVIRIEEIKRLGESPK